MKILQMMKFGQTMHHLKPCLTRQVSTGMQKEQSLRALKYKVKVQTR